MCKSVQTLPEKQKSHEIFRFTASTVDIPTRWNPRAKQQQRVALADFSAAPWQGFEKSERGPSLGSLFPPQAAVASAAVLVLYRPPKQKDPTRMSLAASFLVDIPGRWEPRTNKHPTGVFVAPPAAVPCCSSPVPSTTKKVPRPFGLGTRGGRYRTRTCDLLHVKQMLYQLS